MYKNLDILFYRLNKSKFRSSFHLNKKMKEYVKMRGIDVIREHAYDFVNTRLKPKIIFNDEPDKNYRSLLIKEYLFCVGIKKEILAKAKTLYDSQIATGVIYSFCCNFKLLEEASDKYQSDDFKMHEKASR